MVRLGHQLKNQASLEWGFAFVQIMMVRWPGYVEQGVDLFQKNGTL